MNVSIHARKSVRLAWFGGMWCVHFALKSRIGGEAVGHCWLWGRYFDAGKRVVFAQMSLSIPEWVRCSTEQRMTYYTHKSRAGGSSVRILERWTVWSRRLPYELRGTYSWKERRQILYEKIRLIWKKSSSHYTGGIVVEMSPSHERSRNKIIALRWWKNGYSSSSGL